MLLTLGALLAGGPRGADGAVSKERQRKKLNEYEMWEYRQMAHSGVMAIDQRPDYDAARGGLLQV